MLDASMHHQTLQVIIPIEFQRMALYTFSFLRDCLTMKLSWIWKSAVLLNQSSQSHCIVVSAYKMLKKHFIGTYYFQHMIILRDLEN